MSSVIPRNVSVLVGPSIFSLAKGIARCEHTSRITWRLLKHADDFGGATRRKLSR